VCARSLIPPLLKLLAVGDSDSVVGEVGAVVLSLAPMARLPEFAEDPDEAIFVVAICVKLDDARLDRNVLIVVVQGNYHPLVPVSLVGNFRVFLAFKSRFGPDVDGRTG
jgi:hypothetical protein